AGRETSAKFCLQRETSKRRLTGRLLCAPNATPSTMRVVPGLTSRARQGRHRTAVLRPAGNVVAHRDRALLAIGDRLETVAGDTQRDQVVAGGGCAAGTKRQVILSRAAL